MCLLGVLILVCILTYNGVGGIKSIKTRYDDIYDCVDFYKQPAFDHPMLKDHNFNPGMRPSYLARSVKENFPMKKAELMRVGCPIGTVPIRRIPKGASKMESVVSVKEPSGTYGAGVRTKPGSGRYGGGEMILSIYNPRTNPAAYSQAGLKISGGPDAIQVGWRVDPSLRGDNHTRQFIYTDAGQLHCFDTQCPGFVLVNKDYPLDAVMEPVSQPGGDIYEYTFTIYHDPPSGNWWLVRGFDYIEVGFWPKNIFTGLGELATGVEWAGEVYSPPGVFEPLMGSGYKPSVDNPKYVAYFRNMTVVSENNTFVDADNLEEFATDRSLYDASDKGYRGKYFRHVALFGGARY